VPPELSLTPEIDERLREQAQRVGSAEVVRLLDLLGAALEAVRAGADPRTQLELALVKAATPQTDGSTRALLARIERLEQALAGNPPRPAAGSVAPAQPTPPPAVTPIAAAPVTPAAQTPTPPKHPGVQPTAEPSEAERGVANEAEQALAGEAEQSVASEVEQPVADEQEQPAAAPVAVAVAPGPDDLDALWPAVHESVRAEHGLLGAVLSEATPATLTEEELVLAFPPTAAFHKRKAEDPANRATLLDTLWRLSGRRYQVAFELREDLPTGDGAGGAPPTEEEIMARLIAELDAEELPEDWLQQQKGGE
jgi:DNA polymerase III subunit gamma/tau